MDTSKRPLANGYHRVNIRPMRRSLVLSDESARHPFRASLPPHVTVRAGEIEQAVPWRQRLGFTQKDAETLIATYCAGFIATMAFIL